MVLVPWCLYNKIMFLSIVFWRVPLSERYSTHGTQRLKRASSRGWPPDPSIHLTSEVRNFADGITHVLVDCMLRVAAEALEWLQCFDALSASRGSGSTQLSSQLARP